MLLHGDRRPRRPRRPRPALLLLLAPLLLVPRPPPARAYTWSRCTLPLNYCAHLDAHGTLTPVQASVLGHVRRDGGDGHPPPPPSSSSSPAASAASASASSSSSTTAPSTATSLVVPEIPNIVHFVFGLGDTPAEFHYAYYLNVLAAALVVRPDRILMHFATPPRGRWWTEVQPLVHPVVWDLSKFRHTSNGIPLHAYAHRADVVRLHALLEHGGIYLDLDALPLKPFDDLRRLGAARGALMGGEKVIDPQAAGYVEHRNHYIMVSHFHEHLKKFGPPGAGSRRGFDQYMNRYKQDHWKIWEEWQRDHGYNFLYEDKCRDAESNRFAEAHPRFEWWEDYEFLCNAVMLSMPQSAFMQEWLDRYIYFNDTCWNCHSVWLPTHLARNLMPETVHTLAAPATFFSPGWQPQDLEMLYGKGSYDFSHSYSMHMWFTAAKRQFPWLKRSITPGYFVAARDRRARIADGDKEWSKRRAVLARRGEVHDPRRRGGWSTYQRMIRAVIPNELRLDLFELSRPGE